MRNIFAAIAIVVLCSCWMVGQGPGQPVVADDMLMQQPLPPPEGGAPPNVFFHTQRSGDRMTMSYFAVGDFEAGDGSSL